MGGVRTMEAVLKFLVLATCCGVVTGQGEEERIVNGTIVFGPLPSRSPPLSSASYDDGGLQPLLDLANSFINTVKSGGPPYDLINKHLSDALNIDNSNTSTGNSRRRRSVEAHHRQRRATFLGIEVGDDETVNDILKYETSFVVAFVIGLLWAVLTLIIGSVFGCCRLCNNCGGSLAYDGEDKHANLKRWLLILSLFIALIFVFTGCLCAFVTNQRMSDSISEVNDEVQDAISDLYAFVDDTVKQFRDITDGKFQFVADTLKKDIRGIAKSLGEPILDSFRPQVEPAIKNVLDMADRITVTQVALSDVNRTVDTLLNYTYTLESELNVTRKNLTTLRLNCVSRTNGSFICDILPSEELLETGADFSKVPNVGEELNKVNDVLDIDPSLQELARKGNQSFEDIPQTVENKTVDVEKNIDNQTVKFQAIVQKHVTNVNESAYRVLNDDLSVDDIRDFVRDGTEKAVEFDKYRYGAGVALCVMILLVVMFGVLGVTCGTLNYDPKAPPNERSRASNQSANCLLITAGMVVILSFFLLILAAVCFFAGGNLKILCDPLLDLEFFEKTIDDPSEYDGYVLSRFVLDDNSARLTVSEALRACERNEPLWQALKLDLRRKLNLTRELDIEAKVPELAESFDNLTVNIDEVDILPQDARTNLEEFRDTGVDNIDFDSYTREIEKNLLLFDINEFVSNLTTAATELQKVGQYDLGNDSLAIAQQLSDLNTTVVLPATTSKDQLKLEVSDLRATANDTRDTVSNLLNAMDTLQDFLHGNGSDIIKEEVMKFRDRILGHVRDFAKQAIEWIKQDIGQCQNIHVVYDSATTFMCRNALDGLNGFWVSIGWCCFFMFFVLILSINLAYHFRRLKYSKGFDSEEQNGFSGVPMEPRGKKLVADYVSEETCHYPQTEGPRDNGVYLPNTPTDEDDW